MSRNEEKPRPFSLVEMPNYTYPLNLACPCCYEPLQSRTRKDGRCEKCLKSKDVLPTNYKRVHRKKTDEELAEEEERKARRYDRDDD